MRRTHSGRPALLAAAALLLLAIAAPAPAAEATPLDDFINKPEPKFAWRDTGVVIDKLLFGGQAYILNVTSLEWLDTSRASSPNGAVWSHQVAVVVPKGGARVKNVSSIVLNGGCNKAGRNGTGPDPPDNTDEYILVADNLSYQTGSITVVVYQLPNCPIVYPSDPEKRERTEDAMIAWAWHQYMVDPKHDPEWLPRLPMAKAAFQCMRAVEQFTASKQLAEIEGWFVSGASKRGWTTWMVGAATCPTCSKIIGIAPLVPIVPDLVSEVHRQWMSYDGFTFAFSDYTDVNLTTQIDSDIFATALQVIDPKYYGDRLARLPKVVVLSSDDEFMQFDWSNIWYDQLTGEKHLLIAPDSEHSLATGIPEILATMSATFLSVANGHPTRPNFSYERDTTTGKLSVTIPAGMAHGKVVLRHAQTLSTERRDFRWVRLASNETGLCKLPQIKLKKPMFGGNCIQPIIWLGTTLSPENEISPDQDTVYVATPPEPKDGHWTGYYVEVFFPSDSGIKSEFQYTTPGFAWPNTLPFKDCHKDTCKGRLV